MSPLTGSGSGCRLLSMKFYEDASLREPAQTTCSGVLKLQPGERVLIITNPEEEVLAISHALYAAAEEHGAIPVLMVQPVKTQVDFADPAVLKAISSAPEVLISISAEKIGKDPRGLQEPYRLGDKEFDHIFDYHLNGLKSMRAIWSPGITRDMFRRTVDIDYGRLKRECGALRELFDRADGMRVGCAAGTDLYIGLKGRTGDPDDGDFSLPGSGGNLPAGETFASPELMSSVGRIAYRGSISLSQGDILIDEPILAEVEGGRITSLAGGREAGLLQETINLGENRALSMGQAGELPAGMGEIYRRNARSLGEIGIGLNPAARVVGNMLEDEKAYKTCHIAVGANYADDAPALIHCDGLVLEPTITFILPGGEERRIMEAGKLNL